MNIIKGLNCGKEREKKLGEAVREVMREVMGGKSKTTCDCSASDSYVMGQIGAM